MKTNDNINKPLHKKTMKNKDASGGQVQNLVISDIERIKQLKKTIHHLEGRLHKKNVELDAAHWVWCDGDCETGTHRYATGDLTEEIVSTAERNTLRLRQWFDNNNFRLVWKDMSEQQRAEWFEERKSI